MLRSEAQAAAYDEFASYYDVSDLDRGPEIAFYQSLIRETDRTLLELACGTGTVTNKLADRIITRHATAARVVGVDSSVEMLKFARARDPRIEWVLGDMRAPPISGAFDVVICAYNTLQLIETDEELGQTFRVVRKLLNPGGLFAFDIYQPNTEYLASWPPERVVRSFADHHGRPLEIRESGSYDPQAAVLSMVWRLLDQREVAAPPLVSLDLRLRQFFSNQIEDLISASGLEIRERFGDIHKTPFTNKSKKQVVICARQR